MEYICTVNVLEPSEDLVCEVADVVVAEVLSLQELIEVSLHQCLHNVDSLEFHQRRRPENVQNGYHLKGVKRKG